MASPRPASLARCASSSPGSLAGSGARNRFQMPPPRSPALLAAAKAAPTGQRAGLSFQALQENKRLEAINS